MATLIFTLAAMACGPDTRTTVLVVGVTATANEPAAALTATGKQVLHDAIGHGETHMVIYQAGLQKSLLDEDLTVRRGQQVERYSEQLEEGYKQKLSRVQSTLAQAAGTSGQLDLFGLLAEMARTPGSATLLVHSSGLQTTGQLDLRPGGSDFSVDTALASLPDNALPSLKGKRVIFSGLGQVSGPQRTLPEGMRQNVEKLWLGLCVKFLADACELDTQPLASGPPVASTPVPTLPVPEQQSVIKPRGPSQQDVALPVAMLFYPESADMQPGAVNLLRELTGRFTVGVTATVVGHTATWGPRDGAVSLSIDRSRKVVDTLVGLGVDRAAFTLVTGVGFDEPIVRDTDEAGRLLPEAAEANRAVVLTLYATHGRGES